MFFKTLFRRKVKSHTRVEAPVALMRPAPETLPAYLSPLLTAVEDDWEAPDAGQYQHSFECYLADRLTPLGDMQDALEEQKLLFRLKVERMIEIAPDLFDKVLRRSGFETGFLIDGVSDE